MAGDIVFELDRLHIATDGSAGPAVEIVRDVSVALRRGEVLALAGESGSGKTTIGMCALGYCKPGLRVSGGQVRLFGKALSEMAPGELRALRGRRVAYLAQSAAATFNPSMTVGFQVIETAVVSGGVRRRTARARAVEIFRELRLPEPETIGRRYPHQLSGGQLQRLMLAMALCSEPELLVLDEPTTALDVTTQLEVLRAIRGAIRRRNIAAIYISHDLALVSQVADRVAVVQGGRILECGTVAAFAGGGQTGYARDLVAAARASGRALEDPDRPAAEAPPLLVARGLAARYGEAGPPAISGADLVLGKGETVAVIGESGSGKSTLARTLIGVMAPLSGEILLDGQPLAGPLAERTKAQRRRIQFVHQHADTALNPRHRIGKILGRPLGFYHGMGRRARRGRVAELLALVGLPEGFAARYPPELSGGQKQRVNLARALAAEPDVIICDEVISALDSIVAQRILALLSELQEKTGVSILFITHDISVAARLSERVVVIHGGRIVDSGPAAQVLRPPCHPYTQRLIDAVPSFRVGWIDEVRPEGAELRPPEGRFPTSV